MIRILLVDDQNILRQGVKLLLDSRKNIEVVGTAEDGKSAINQVEVLQPDIVLIDIEMPGVNGITATSQICQRFPKTKVIVLSSHEDQKYIGKALQAGAEGYLLKSTLIENLEQAILSVYQGQSQIESRLLKKAIAELSLSNRIDTIQPNDSYEAKEQIPQNKSISSEKNSNKNSIKNKLDILLNSTNTSSLNGSKETKSSNINNSNNDNLKKSKLKLRKIYSKRARSKQAKFNAKFNNVFDSLITNNLFNRRLQLLFLLLIAALLLTKYLNTSSVSSSSNSAKQQEINILPVRTMVVKPVTSYSTSRTYTGEVMALRTSEVGFERTGKLIQVFVEEGDKVTAGAPLAELDTSNIKAEREGLLFQKVRAQAILAELKNGARQEQIAAAEANVREVQGQLELEELRRERREYLYQEGAISQEQLDEINFNRQALQERFANAQSSLDELKNGTRVEQIDAQQAAIDRLDAEIANLDIVISKSILKSPFSSTVSARNLDEGTVVEAGRSVIRLIENSQFKVKVGVPVGTSEQIQPGDEQQLTIAGQNYKATVISVLPELDTTTRTRFIVFKLPVSAANKVSPRQIARLKIIQTEYVEGYWLPITALLKGDRGLWTCYAVVDSPDGKNKQAERRYVELVESQEDRVLVKGTIKSGDEIIIAGTHRLIPGQLINTSKYTK